MNNTYQLKLSYPKTFSLHKITSLVESVNGVRIQHLNFISKGKDVAGILIFEASDLIKFNSVVRLIRTSNEILKRDQVLSGGNFLTFITKCSSAICRRLAITDDK